MVFLVVWVPRVKTLVVWAFEKLGLTPQGFFNLPSQIGVSNGPQELQKTTLRTHFFPAAKINPILVLFQPGKQDAGFRLRGSSWDT
jgi:hypothetical protein